MTLPTTYSPSEVEARWYAEWEKQGYFKPDPNSSRDPFTIVIPPPNVTGILHMGHALNNTLQDILIRWKRMQGCAALWVPGTDHAGIATQNVVERQLAKEGLTRQKLGREKFIERVWTWKKEYGSTIVRQLRRLGSSCDWSRERFTMDEGLSRAVETCFLQLYESGLIYRGYYLVNWCPRCRTALSDEEVIHEEVNGHLWHIRYPLVVRSREFGVGSLSSPNSELRTPSSIVVATTRPETLLGDLAVAVHPEDERYRGLIGSSVVVPLCRRPVPIIADSAVDPKFGTGALKITPAHDPVDLEMAKRHPELIPPNVPRQDWTSIPLRVMQSDGTMSRANVPPPYQGLDRFECRKRVVEDLEKEGLLVKTEDYRHSVGHCYRCRTIIEPTLSPQWFVKMEPLAKLGIEAVEKDGMRFVPERWTKVYLDWLRNIRDWCISRQIWWGHQIPVWYCLKCNTPAVRGQGRWIDGRYIEPGMIVASYEEIEYSAPKCPTCGECREWVQDEDVLDTWFSSWLWPFSTLGWPEEKSPDLKRFYPTSALVTGQDILFFWVARMVMAGKFFMKKIPFKEVTIHGIIRVEGGKKMSKSLGNIIDPLEVIDRMGADALRFSIAHMTSEGQDLYLSEGKFLLGRDFANKLWNASRLILEGMERLPTPGAAVEGTPVRPELVEGRTVMVSLPNHDRHLLTLPDRWILSRLQQAIQAVTDALNDYRFNGAAKHLYEFLWHEFCDWYLEIAKLQREKGLVPAVSPVAQQTEWVLQHVLEISLRLLHPFMPFITEELWQLVHRPLSIARRSTIDDRRLTIMKAAWPAPDPSWVDTQVEEDFALLQAAITEVRNIRSLFRVPQKEKVDLIIQGAVGLDFFGRFEKIIQRLGWVSHLRVELKADRPQGSVVSHLPIQASMGPFDLIVPLAGLVDLQVERRRIEKEMEQRQGRAKNKRDRLGDPTFRSKAPAEVIAEEEKSLQELEAELVQWAENLKQLS